VSARGAEPGTQPESARGAEPGTQPRCAREAEIKTDRIMTVLGPIEPDQLGACQAHEHLFVKEGPATRTFPDLLLDDYGKTLQELTTYFAAGGRSLVDAQPVGSGRMAGLQERVSRESGVHVVAATGFHRPLFYDESHWIHHASMHKLVGLFTEELETGLYLDGESAWPVERGTARAGIIKTAAGPDGISGRWGTLFDAAAETAGRTAAPVLIHTEEGHGAMEILRFFLDRGVAAHQLIFCHLDRVAGNSAYMAEVAAAGAWLELDTIGRFKYHDDREEAGTIGKLISLGHGAHMLLGLDVTRARMRAYGGTIGLAYLHDRFLPLLRQSGILEADLRRMMVENPAKALRRHTTDTRNK